MHQNGQVKHKLLNVKLSYREEHHLLESKSYNQNHLTDFSSIFTFLAFISFKILCIDIKLMISISLVILWTLYVICFVAYAILKETHQFILIHCTMPIFLENATILSWDLFEQVHHQMSLLPWKHMLAICKHGPPICNM